jgi:hypothetical protein
MRWSWKPDALDFEWGVGGERFHRVVRLPHEPSLPRRRRSAPADSGESVKIPPDAVIPMEKLTSYLLVARDWDDKSKFLAQVGFNRQNPHLLLEAIRRLAAGAEAVEDRANEYGEILRAEGDLGGPDGQSLSVVTIWIRERLTGRVRFVTLKPWKEKAS